MITDKEIQAVDLSPTKTDFYQIWNELLDTASKLSERWDPTSTNESDPGIVLLKVLTAVADKLNYTVDKNILEAFMPSATQEESMRKLCDMLGYNIKYYQSAITKVNITYTGEEDNLSGGKEITLRKYYTNIKNSDEDKNYVLLENAVLTNDIKTATVDAIEGEFVEAESGELVDLAFLDDNHRYYLPETQVAENGIFIYSSNGIDKWEKVTNLNTVSLAQFVYKFGYDSKIGAPYIQFPDDISSIIGDGLYISYIRTNGINGNVSVNTLINLELGGEEETTTEEGDYTPVADDFSVTNPAAATNGRNIETINEAYNSYKKTIGTFDTLVTCRDYMNKIYQLTVSETDTTPLVSNIIVSDIRDDINRSIELCTFGEYGINYVNKSITEIIEDENGEDEVKDKINHFDLVLYPFKVYNNLGTETDYRNSFRYSEANKVYIESGIENNKTLSHQITYPNTDEIVCIKIYLQLKAKITTTYKVNAAEEKLILNNIYSAIYNRFNLRNIDFGEEIPFDDILDCIEKADTRIKNVSLDEPALQTKYYVNSTGDEEFVKVGSPEHLQISNKLALRNILAGRVPMFNYNTKFKPEFNEKLCEGTIPGSTTDKYDIYYPESGKEISKLVSHYEPSISAIGDGLTLNENEVIKFRAPNYRTTITYPGYVNYFLHLDPTKHQSSQQGKPLVAHSLADFISKCFTDLTDSFKEAKTVFEGLINNSSCRDSAKFATDDLFTKAEADYGAIFKLESNGKYVHQKYFDEDTKEEQKFFINPNANSGAGAGAISAALKALQNDIYYANKLYYRNNSGLYKQAMVRTYPVGEFVDEAGIKYISIDTPRYTGPVFITGDIGQNAVLHGIKSGSEYKLQPGEYLLINYTNSTSDEEGTETKTVVNQVVTDKIIKPTFENSEEICDTEELINAQKATYNKTEGFNFIDVTNPEGLLTLGVNDKIELREPITVTLGDPDKTTSGNLVYLYWILNNPEVSENYTYFKFNEDNNTAYTLKEGEYIYYTDANKTDFAYYGNGTRVVKGTATPELKRINSKDQLTADDIATRGLAAAIDWTPFNLNGPTRNITLQEYQYQVLTSGSILKTLEFDTTPETLSNNWIACKKATWKDSVDSETPHELPDIIIENSKGWEVRSILEYNCGPVNSQTLHTNDSVEIFYVGNNTTTADITLSGNGDNDGKVSFKSNYILQTSIDTIDVEALTKDKDGNKLDALMLKLFTVDTDETSTTTVNVSATDFGTNWTKVQVWDKSPDEMLKLDTIINSSEKGLIMFYYIKNKDVSDNIYLKSVMDQEGEEVPGNLSIYNLNTNNHWWNTISDNKYILRPGLNIIEVSSSIKRIEIYGASDSSEAKAENLIFSNLDLIPNDETAINPKLDYQVTTAGTASPLEQLLADINAIDTYDAAHVTGHNFYYNTIIDNSLAIDLNDNIKDTTDENYETLTSPRAWYDHNNINNKFVVSEIDAEYLAKGITIANSSKR